MKPKETVFVLKSIGVLRTPYNNKSPHQPVKEEKGSFFVELHNEFIESLKYLDTFRYVYIIFYLDRVIRTNNKTAKPPWADGVEVGVFASRSPDRPNPIGLSVVELKKISGNRLYISPIDAFDTTPVLDIKPYFDDLDAKKDANLGWVETLDKNGHLALHIKGIPHDH